VHAGKQLTPLIVALFNFSYTDLSTHS